MIGNHHCSSDGRVNLSDTTLLQNDILIILKYFLKLLELFVHCNNNTYLHACYLFVCKGNKKLKHSHTNYC